MIAAFWQVGAFLVCMIAGEGVGLAAIMQSVNG
jgi:hypothetical protein